MAPALRLSLSGFHLVVASHALLAAVAAVVATLVAVRMARTPDVVLAGAPLVVVAALAGAHLLFRVERGGPGGLWSGGLSSVGGIAGAVAAIAVLARVTQTPMRILLDACAPAGLIALGIGRVGCFLAGCCYGRPSVLPWAVVFPELGPPARHPLQLYSAVADLGLAVWVLRTGGPPGVIARRACIGLGVVRVALECLRDPAATTAILPGVTLPQAAGLMLVAAGLWAFPGARPQSVR